MKRSHLPAIALLTLFTFGCEAMKGRSAPPPDQPISAATPIRQALQAESPDSEGETLFRGLVFGHGPVADVIPEVRDNWKLDRVVASAADRTKVLEFQGRLITAIRTADPDFFTSFRTEVMSGDHLRIQAVLGLAGRNVVRATTVQPEWAQASQHMGTQMSLVQEGLEAAQSNEGEGQGITQFKQSGPPPLQVCGPTVCVLALALLLAGHTVVALQSWLAVFVAVYLAAWKYGPAIDSDPDPDAGPDEPTSIRLINEKLVASIATKLVTGTWHVGGSYNVGDQVTFNGLDYECRQAHVAEAGWEPPNTPALWARINAGNQWTVQVMYNVNDVVTFNGVQYRAIQAHQSQAGWEPPATPALWVLASGAFLWPEAESATVTSPLQKVTDATASGGQYIQVPSGNNSTGSVPSTGHATLTFTAPAAGTYKVWGRVNVAADTTDSFWVRIDSGAWQKWNGIPLNPGSGTPWHWDDVHNGDNNSVAATQFSLSAGNHTLEIAYRENLTKLDRLLITNDLSYVPTGTGP